MRQSVSLTMLTDEPPYLSVGTEVSAKYKGAFCEAKVRKVDKTVKCKVSFKLGCGTYTVLDSSIKGTLRVGASVEAKHPEKKEFFEATITKIQDCSQYTVVFDDGDITTLRRSALCLKSGRHFAESETLDQLPLTHPEHFSNPVVGAGGRRGRRRLLDDSSGDEETTRKGKAKEEKEADIGKVVCVELGDKKKVKDNWFPGLVVSPNAQDTVQIRVKDEYLIRSFSDGRYYTVPKKEASEFTREIGIKVDNNTLKTAVEKALRFIDKDELPPHWDRELLFGLVDSDINSDSDEGLDSESSDDEPREEKDHFVAQLYKFMDDRGTPINNCPSIGGKDLDLYKLFNVVHKLNGYNRVTNRNQWKIVSTKLGLGITASIITQVKHAYKKYLHSFEDFYRKLGCTMVSHPRSNRARNKSGRSLIRDRDRTTPSNLKAKLDSSSFENTKSNSKSDENVEKDGGSETRSKEEATEKKEDKSKSKDEEVEKNAKNKHSKKDIEMEEVSESEDSVSVSEEAYSMSRPTSSLRKKFPTLKASPVVVRDKRKADSSPDGRKCKRTRLLKSRSSSGSDVKTTSDNEDDSKGKEFSYQRNTTRSRSKEDVKTKKEPEKDKKLKSAGNNNSENQKKMFAVKAKRNENEEPQKKGRKRRNTDTGGKSPNPAEEDLNLPCLPSYKSVFTGDVLKIYYGAPGEPKVIYEAKVVDIKENESGETLYLVHYAGWNSRYDEWVKRNKIADNLNWTPARGKVVPVGKQNSKSCAAQKRKPSSGKNEQSAGGPGTRSTTPLSVTSTSSRNKSPATSVPPGGKRVTRNMGDVKPPKRTRRVSGHTDLSVDSESESDAGESVSDTEGNKRTAPSTGKEETSPKTACSKKLVKKPMAKKKVVKKAVEEKVGESIEEETGKNKRTKKGGVVGKEKETEEKKSVVEEKSESGKEADEPKGRDFDLNEIRSELKGIDKAVKMNSELTLIESSEESGKPATEEKGVVTVEETVEVLPEPSKEEKMMVKPEDKSPEKKEVKDDIYEFKEPEPFEYQEVLRPINRMFEEGDRSPDKTVKKPILLTEKKEVCKFEVDVKSRFRKTIGKKMKEVTSAELKKESPSKSDKAEVLSKVEVFPTSEFHVKPPEKEIPVLKVEVEVRKSMSPEPVRLFPPIQEDQQQPERKMEVTPEKEQLSKPQLEVETCKSPQTSKLSPEPPSLTPVTNSVFGNNRPPTSPLLTLINEDSKQHELKKGENGPDEEDDPISAAIQRVIAQSSMDDDSDDMDLFAVSSSNVTAAPVTATAAVAVTTTAIPATAAAVVVTITATNTASTTPVAPPLTTFTAPEEVPELPKPSQLTTNETEVLVRKKVCSKRKSVGKRLMLSKEFVMDDSSTDSDSDSAEERLVIVNEDESANDDSNRTPKNPVVSSGVEDEDKKLLTGTATATATTATATATTTTSTSTSMSTEARFKKAEETKSPPSSVETSQPRKIHPNDSSASKKGGPPGKSEEEWKIQKQDKSAEQEEGENNLRSLLCEETIPGSPAPMTETKESSESKMNVLDMQFANSSQPVSLPPPAPSIGKAEGNEAVVVMDNTPPTTPESNLSSMSGSPRDDRVGSSSLDNESSKSLRDSSEIDVDNEHHRMKNLKYPKKPDKDSSDSLAKKKWRNRKRSESLSDGNKRVRQPVGRPPKTKDLGSDSDDTSENSQTGGHNVNTESLINSRSQKPSKYNFYCELDPELDATQRIALLEQKLQECRKTYMNVKSKLASLDRRRKKLRRREREEKASAAAAARSQDVACQ